ncbi:hypothetical protein AB0O04_37645, partial [Streptomyces althioticus]
MLVTAAGCLRCASCTCSAEGSRFFARGLAGGLVVHPSRLKRAGMRRITNPKHVYVDHVGTVVDYEGEKHVIT